MTTAEAEDLFASLAPVPPGMLSGLWRGRAVETGHPVDELLRVSGWYGKDFVSDDEVHPLVHEGQFGRYRLDPGRAPLRLARALGLGRLPGARAVFRLVGPLLATSRPRARLRQVLHGGTPTTAMIYDQRPIIDVFRKVDEDTVMGRMDERGAGRPAFFALSRDG